MVSTCRYPQTIHLPVTSAKTVSHQTPSGSSDSLWIAARQNPRLSILPDCWLIAEGGLLARDMFQAFASSSAQYTFAALTLRRDRIGREDGSW